MISSIALQNFQSHDSSLLEFDPGVNVIVGDSDSGKTAILRALNWVLTNRPTGEAFRRNGSSSTRVTVDTSDGAVTRVRSDRENLYFGPSAEKLAAIGTSVPESVLKLLRMDPDVNIQRQLDAPFLLSCSAGEVAQRLNAVVGLDDIDVGLSNVARRVKQNQFDFSEIDRCCKELSEQVQSFAYLAEMEQEIRSTESEFERLVEQTGQEDVLIGLLQDVRGAISLLAELSDVKGLLVHISEAEKLLSQREKQITMQKTLSAAIFEIVDSKAVLTQISDVDYLLQEYEEAFSIAQRLSKQQQDVFSFQTIIVEATNMDRDLQIVDNLLRKNEVRFHREFPSVCPLCGRKDPQC